MQFATGVFNTGTGTTPVPVATPFDPTGLYVWWNGRATTGVARGTIQAGFGIVDLTSGACISGASKDAQNPTQANHGMRGDASVWTLDNTGADDGVGTVALGVGGFTFTPSDAFSVDLRVHYVAIGGTRCKAGVTAAEPATATTAATTGVGFKPKMTILLGMGGVASYNGTRQVATDYNLTVGFACMNPSGTIRNAVIANGADAAVATTSTRQYFRSSAESLACFDATASATPKCRAGLTSFDTDGFTQTWNVVVGSGTRNYLYLAVEQGNYELQQFTTSVTGGATFSTTPGFRSIGVICGHTGRTGESTAGSGNATGRFLVGASDAALSQHASATRDDSGTAGGSNTTADNATNCIYNLTTGAVSGAAQLTAISNTQLTWTITTSDSGANLGFALAIGDEQVPPRRARLLEEPSAEPILRRTWAPPPPVVAADMPFVRARRLPDEAPDEPRLRRLFVQLPAAAVADQPAPVRRRVAEDAPDEPRSRRALAPIPPAVTPDNPPPHASTALARRLADESREEPDPRPRKSYVRPTGSIVVTDDTSTAAVDLTAIGTSDWRTWMGTGIPADVVRKVSGANQISDWTLVGGAGPFWAAGFEPNVVQWSDGDPIPVGSHAGILWTAGNFKGFTWTVPADQTPRTIHLYLDVANMGSAAVQADLSDLSAPQGSIGKLTNGEWNVHITYQAASAGQTLTLSFIVQGASANAYVRGLALAGPAIPNDMPFVRRLWQALASWDVEELLPRKRRAPILAAVTPDQPPPRARARLLEEPAEERGARRPLAPIAPAAVADNPPPRARTRPTDSPEDETRARRPLAPIPTAAPDSPPPRTARRREEEPEAVTGLRGRKVVPAPAVAPDNPPPRAGRSNWRVAWDSWEPVELLRKVYRLVFPGVTSTTPVPPFHVVEDDYSRTNVDATVALTVLADEIVLEASPMKPRKVGDNAAPYSGTLYSAGAPRSLAGSTVALWMWDSRTHSVKLAGVACTVEPSGTGTWSYLPSAAEVGPAGIYEYELRETTSGGKGATYPSTGRIKFVIEEAIG